MRGADPGAIPAPADRDDTLAKVRRRLATVSRRDLSSAVEDMLRPSAPGYLAERFGRAARQVGTLAAALGPQPLDAGMVNNASGVPTVSIPRLSGGAAVEVQASQNAAVQETDPTTASASSPMASVAGMVDLSRQLFDLSRPRIDAVLAADLGRALGSKLDSQIIAGSAGSGQMRGLLAISGILSVTGSVTNVATLVPKIWAAFDAIAGPSGFGNPSSDEYVTVLHPRRWAWLHSGSGAASVPAEPVLPGEVIVSAVIPTNLGSNTNEDVVLVADRSALLLLAQAPQFEVFPEVGSSTLTVRIAAWQSAAVLAEHPAAICKVTGLTPPSF